MMNQVKIPTSYKVKKILLKMAAILFTFFVLFLIYFPILIIIIQAFNSDGTGNTFKGLTLKWFYEMFNDRELMKAIRYTLLITFLSTIISTIFGTLSAIGINSLSKKKRKKMILLNNVPILNADVVTGVFLFLVFKVIGILIGIEYILGFWTLLLVHILFSVPYVVLSVLPKLNEIDDNLYDAALDLGCTSKQALLKVIIPSIKSGIISGALLAFTMSIDDFVISYFVAGPNVENFSIWFNGHLRVTRGNPWQKACAYNTLITLVTLTGLVIYNIIKKRKVKEK